LLSSRHTEHIVVRLGWHSKHITVRLSGHSEHVVVGLGRHSKHVIRLGRLWFYIIILWGSVLAECLLAILNWWVVEHVVLGRLLIGLLLLGCTDWVINIVLIDFLLGSVFDLLVGQCEKVFELLNIVVLILLLLLRLLSKA
jgi:hypothetical protein